MLQTRFSLDVLQHEVRRRVCTQCQWRPRNSEALGPEVARRCEPACPVFRNLPGLARTALLLDPMLRPVEQTLRRQVGQICAAEPKAAGHPDPLPAGGGPLERYRDPVVRTIAWYVHA